MEYPQTLIVHIQKMGLNSIQLKLVLRRVS